MDDLYRHPAGVQTRWINFENPTGARGAGGRENRTAKGHAFDIVKPGASCTLLDVNGCGVIRRIWLTHDKRSPTELRAMRIDMYWDGCDAPAVSAPLSDFFGVAYGRMPRFESSLFVNTEGRAFVGYAPMPFRRSARIVLTNETDGPIMLFYEINYTLHAELPPDMLYFHACWRRENPTTIRRDFEVMPRVRGRGRYIGCNLGVAPDPVYDAWWGEGETKVYLDGDDAFPTLAGTGAEDYVSSAWGQGQYATAYAGSPLVQAKPSLYCMYRYHIPDPVYFERDCRVALQQIGGDMKAKVIQMLDRGLPLEPVSIAPPSREAPFVKLLELNPGVDLRDPSLPDGWVNFYRRDDWCATAYWYLDSPDNRLPPLASVAERTADLRVPEEKPAGG
ncbi:MAG: DUF2961 domain-containing protein [Planctomycetes bacterium]|nr:DUF2961 domain-containing protein [Planctomycetota bacterium]